jgi:hypothetical protein
MDYSESILHLKAYIKKIEDALNKRQYENCVHIAQEIIAESKNLDDIIFNLYQEQVE